MLMMRIVVNNLMLFSHMQIVANICVRVLITVIVAYSISKTGIASNACMHARITLRFRITWLFTSARTLDERLKIASEAGEGVTWYIFLPDGRLHGSKVGTWRIAPATPTVWPRNALWGAASGSVSAAAGSAWMTDTAAGMRDFWGHASLERPTFDDGDVLCNSYWEDGQKYLATTIRNEIRLETTPMVALAEGAFTPLRMEDGRLVLVLQQAMTANLSDAPTRLTVTVINGQIARNFSQPRVAVEGCATISAQPIAFEDDALTADLWPIPRLDERPMYVYAPQVYKTRISQNSSYPGDMNTLSVAFVVNIALTSALHGVIEISGLRGAEHATGELMLLDAPAASGLTWVNHGTARPVTAKEELSTGDGTFVDTLNTAIVAFEDVPASELTGMIAVSGGLSVDANSLSLVLTEAMVRLDVNEYLKTAAGEYVRVVGIADDKVTLTVQRDGAPPGLTRKGARAVAAPGENVTLVEGGVNVSGTVITLASAMVSLDVHDFLKAPGGEYMGVVAVSDDGKTVTVTRDGSPPGLLRGSPAAVAAGAVLFLAEPKCDDACAANKRLAAALDKSASMTEFSVDEWASFRVSGLLPSNFVVVDGYFFTPVAVLSGHYELFSSSSGGPKGRGYWDNENKTLSLYVADALIPRNTMLHFGMQLENPSQSQEAPDIRLTIRQGIVFSLLANSDLDLTQATEDPSRQPLKIVQGYFGSGSGIWHTSNNPASRNQLHIYFSVNAALRPYTRGYSELVMSRTPIMPQHPSFLLQACHIS